jgi:rare lipoprotein A (peptidoglycan hydrolase)
VRKRVESLSFIAIVTVVFAVVSCGSALQAQSDTPQSSSSQSQQQPQQPPDTQAPLPQQPESQQTPSQQPSQGQPSQGQASQDQGSKSETSDAGGASEFIGTVVKQGDKYMFQDAASGQTYDIDHQDEVKKFEGKKVRVHGTLDPSAKMIHVQ